MSRQKKLYSRVGVNGKGYTVDDANTAAAIAAAASSGGAGANSTSDASTVTAIADGAIPAGSLCEYSGYDAATSKIIVKRAVSTPEAIIGCHGAADGVDAADGEELTLYLHGLVPSMNVEFDPTTGATTAASTEGKTIWAYYGDWSRGSRYDYGEYHVGTAVEWLSTTKCSVLFSPSYVNTSGITRYGIEARNRQEHLYKLDAASGVAQFGFLLVHAGTEHTDVVSGPPNVKKKQEILTLYDPVGSGHTFDQVIGASSFTTVNGFHGAYISSGEFYAPVTSGSLGATVYTDSTDRHKLTTATTTGEKVGTIVRSEGSDWIVRFIAPAYLPAAI